MKKDRIGYCILYILVILSDQLSKWRAINVWKHEYVFTPWLSFKVIVNRGISWGLLSVADTNRFIFFGLTAIIILLTLGIALYALKRYQKGYSIVGEILVVAGSSSNILDRWIHGGVIDFIVLRYQDYIWPVFNVADVAVVIGVFYMFFHCLTRQDDHG